MNQLTMALTPVAAIALVSLLGACGGGDFIIGGRSEDPCLESIPACPPKGYAQCIMDSSRYAEVTFPGFFSFLVNVDAKHELEVVLLLAEQRDAGFETQITWWEPGCSDAYTYNSEGADLFYEARDTGVLTRKMRVEVKGEHLIEIESDMQALVLITSNVIVPGTQ